MPIDVGVALGYEEDRGLGPELTVNGDFTGGTTVGWTASNSVLTVVGGRMRITNNGLAFPQAFQLIPVTIGKTYQYHVEQYAGTAITPFTQLVAQGIGNYIQLNNPGIFDGQIVATSAGFFFSSFINDATLGNFADFDNFSLREVQ